MKQTPTSTINRSIKIPLSIFGIWPNSSYILLCRLFWTITLAAAQSFQYRYFIKYMYIADLSDLMDCLSAALSFSQFFFKIAMFWLNQRDVHYIIFNYIMCAFNVTVLYKFLHVCSSKKLTFFLLLCMIHKIARRTFDKILAMMAMDWKENSSADFSRRATISKAILSHNFSNFCFGTVSIVVIFYTGSVFVFNLDESDMSMRPLILKMDFPFSTDIQFMYEFLLFSQISYTILGACCNIMVNTLLIVLVVHLAGQIDILSKWLTEIISKEDEYRMSLTMIRKIIEKHRNIITFSKSIENLYSNIALILFVSDTLVICALGFVIVTSIGRVDTAAILTKCIGFYLMMNSEVFMFCFAGEYLNSKSKTIGEAAYNSRWYQCRVQDSRIILFLIMRSQNQMTITVGKFMDLSFERFVSIIKASASYVSVMLALY